MSEPNGNSMLKVYQVYQLSSLRDSLERGKQEYEIYPCPYVGDNVLLLQRDNRAIIVVPGESHEGDSACAHSLF